MIKTKKIGFFLFISLLFTFAMLYSNNKYAKASDILTPNDFKFVIDSTDRPTGSEYEMKTAEQVINVRIVTDKNQPFTVKWMSSVPSIVDVEEFADPKLNSFVKLKRNGPGYSSITALITSETGTVSISFLAKVSLEIDRTKTKLATVTTNTTKVLLLDLNKEEEISKTIYLKYLDPTPTVSGGAVKLDTVEWSSDNDKIVEIKDGVATAKSAGTAVITVTTLTSSGKGEQMLVSLVVIVKPSFGLYVENTKRGESVENVNTAQPVFPVPPEFQIQSNGNPATNLIWEVYSVSGDGKTKKKLSPDSALLKYSVSSLSGNVNFSGVKAGTYEIYAYSNNTFRNAATTYMKIIVPINFDDRDIVMAVGDDYDILENSNIPDMDIFQITYYNGTSVNNSSSIASVNDKGVITAKRSGKVKIQLKYTGKIFDSSLIVDDIIDGEIDINVTVIDEISLSTTKANMFTSGTLLLQAVYSGESDIQWSSSAPEIAEVNEDGLVTAKKPGIAVITAKQKINGITKKATCEITVQQSVTSITLTPETLTLAINEFATLHAEVAPKNLKVELQWRSSNESVVRIDKPNAVTTTIEAVGGGTAVVSAINQDNVVVGYTHITVRKPAESITLSETKITVPFSKDRIQLRATVNPQDVTEKGVTWSSTDTTKAKVDANGLVTLVNPGTVSIIATSVDNPAVTAICNITIEIPVASVALDETTKTMYVGQSSRLSYVLLPVNASKNSITWTSTNTSVATVDATGMVTAKAVGTAVIMVKTLDGGHTVYCTINVRQVATGVKFDVKELKLKAGEYYYINAQLSPADSTDSSLLWESSDTKVAIVDDKGKVTAKSSGTAIIMARTEAGAMAYCKITVSQPVVSLIMNFTEKTIYVGEDFELKASINPSEASNLSLTWKSSNTKIASISDKGIVKGLVGGVTVITATTVDGGYTATCVVTVRERITNLKLNYESYRLGVDKSVILVATVANDTATNQKVKWISSNPKVATVSKTGKVTGIKYGYATITAIAQDGSEAEASCEIEVVKPVSRITLSKSYASMLVGEGLELKVTLEPKNATYKRVKWTTSDNKVAIVDDDGFVTALNPGTATITAEAEDSSGKKAICYITVNERIPSTGITVIDKKLVLISGDVKQVEVTMVPANSTDSKIWSSDNSAVAKVDKYTGKITAKATGTANVTVMTSSGKLAVIEITVIGLNVTELKLEQYTEYQLEVEGANAPVKWDISNPEVAVVTNGKVSTRARGTATITATVNGRKLRCKLTVVKIS